MFGFCVPLATTGQCSGAGSIQLLPSGAGCQQSFGSLSNQSATLLGADPAQGVVLTYAGGAPCSNGAPSYTTLQLVCNATAVGRADVSAFSVLNGGCQLDYTLQSAAGCPYASVRTVAPLGAGWIAFIVLLVSATLYCVAGVAYKRYRYGSSGVEALPNVDFWRRVYAVPARLVRGAGARGRGVDDGLDDYASMAAQDDWILPPPDDAPPPRV